MPQMTYPIFVEQWNVFEVSFHGKSDGNPFVDYEIHATFTGCGEQAATEGFYDGEGIYKVRFMPGHTGTYFFTVSGSFSDEWYTGSFTATPPAVRNHGPVHPVQRCHFRYDDGTPYRPIGTTCYVWQLQEEILQRHTLETLRSSPFNKLRFCVFPKHYDYNLDDPVMFPYEGTPCDCRKLTKQNFQQYNGRAPGNHFDYDRFNRTYFHRLERRLLQLSSMGIQADLILFHPYDRWGFSCMTEAQDERYLRYIIARLSAFRNVWWALANEYDLITPKKDWDKLGSLIRQYDPYQHPRSIHNCHELFDHGHDWVTHCSIQRTDLYKSGELTTQWRQQYGKPVMLDEIAYEGNIQFGWGNLSGEELVRRFWEATCRGGYAGHGETFVDHIPEDTPADRKMKLWWAHGGRLKGSSVQRLHFLQDILADIPNGWYLREEQTPTGWDEVRGVPDCPEQDEKQIKDYYLIYYSFMRPLFRELYLDDETPFEVEIIDTWNMTVTRLGVFQGRFTVSLGSRPYMAVRLKRVEKAEEQAD